MNRLTQLPRHKWGSAREWGFDADSQKSVVNGSVENIWN